MLCDVEVISGELLARRGERPEGNSGVYAIIINDLNALPPMNIPANGLLYVGMTSLEEGSGARNHFEYPHSGRSTLRRSLGALLKEGLQPKLLAIRRAPGASRTNWKNYRFQDQGEVALTHWMEEHLKVNFVALEGDRDAVRQCERQLIQALEPPLNLTDWKNPQAPTMRTLRALCAKEARAADDAPQIIRRPGDTAGKERRINRRVKLPSQVAAIYRAVSELEALYPERKFTPDGHLVGSIGEVVAAESLGLTLHRASYPGHDAFDAAGDVQIKMTGGRSVALYSTCDRLVVLQVVSPEEAEIVYDGPGTPAWDEAGKLGKNGQRVISLKRLRALADR